MNDDKMYGLVAKRVKEIASDPEVIKYVDKNFIGVKTEEEIRQWVFNAAIGTLMGVCSSD